MEDIVIPLTIVPILFIGLPWLVFHYITKWKTAATLTSGDEKLLDELHDAARNPGVVRAGDEADYGVRRCVLSAESGC